MQRITRPTKRTRAQLPLNIPGEPGTVLKARRQNYVGYLNILFNGPLCTGDKQRYAAEDGKGPVFASHLQITEVKPPHWKTPEDLISLPSAGSPFDIEYHRQRTLTKGPVFIGAPQHTFALMDIPPSLLRNERAVVKRRDKARMTIKATQRERLGIRWEENGRFSYEDYEALRETIENIRAIYGLDLRGEPGTNMRDVLRRKIQQKSAYLVALIQEDLWKLTELLPRVGERQRQRLDEIATFHNDNKDLLNQANFPFGEWTAAMKRLKLPEKDAIKTATYLQKVAATILEDLRARGRHMERVENKGRIMIIQTQQRAAIENKTVEAMIIIASEAILAVEEGIIKSKHGTKMGLSRRIIEDFHKTACRFRQQARLAVLRPSPIPLVPKPRKARMRFKGGIKELTQLVELTAMRSIISIMGSLVANSMGEEAKSRDKARFDKAMAAHRKFLTSRQRIQADKYKWYYSDASMRKAAKELADEWRKVTQAIRIEEEWTKQVPLTLMAIREHATSPIIMQGFRQDKSEGRWTADDTLEWAIKTKTEKTEMAQLEQLVRETYIPYEDDSPGLTIGFMGDGLSDEEIGLGVDYIAKRRRVEERRTIYFP